MFFLSKHIAFPAPALASEDGLLAYGGDLSIERLLLAYRSGIFPWFDDDRYVMWWSPDPRMVLFPEKIRVSKSMKQLFRKEMFRVTYNKAFGQVIRLCSKAPRKDQEGTWITEGMVAAYEDLHRLGHAVSVEVWEGEELVGGLYGIDLGDVFCGESMFAKKSNASKYGFITLVQKLQKEGYRLIDCQVYTDHLASMGAEEIARDEFLTYLNLGSK